VTKTIDASGELARLEQEAAAADAEVDRIRQLVQERDNTASKLRGARLALTFQEDNQVRDGIPVSGSEYEKLTKQLHEVAAKDYADELQVAEARAREALDQVRRHHGAHTRELLLALLPEHEEDAEAWHRDVAAIQQRYERIVRRQTRAAQLCHSGAGYDPHDFGNSDRPCGPAVDGGDRALAATAHPDSGAGGRGR
jgi:hypothetical protein